MKGQTDRRGQSSHKPLRLLFHLQVAVTSLNPVPSPPPLTHRPPHTSSRRLLPLQPWPGINADAWLENKVVEMPTHIPFGESSPPTLAQYLG